MMSILCLFIDDADAGDNNDEDRHFMATTKGTRRKHNAEDRQHTFAGYVEETTVDEDSVVGARWNATAVIEQAIKRFKIPQDPEKDYRIATVPKRTPNRSLAWDLGVRIEKKSDASVGKWYCLASEQCRRAKQCLSVNGSSSTNAMKHLEHERRGGQCCEGLRSF
ncbi:hypothetical protein Plhal304r1_c005g0020451 [Plasmopara halstedii]